MARSRNIKPGFFQNDELSELDPLARLAFIGLWTVADYKGCVEYRPKMLKIQILPYDNCDFEIIANNLEQARFIRYYSNGGKQYIKIVNFEKHQNPHKNERDAGSDIPDILEEEKITNENKELSKDGTKPDLFGTTTEPLALIPDSLLLIPSTLIPDSTPSSDAGRMVCPVNKIIELYHLTMPNNPCCKSVNADRRGAIKARWNEAAKLGYDPFGYKTEEDGLMAWETFFSVCAESEFLTGKVEPTQGRKRFIADIDFLFSPSGFAKCLENKYL